MKIVKETVISVPINDIWSWLSDKTMIQGYWNLETASIPAFKPGSNFQNPPYKISVKTPGAGPMVTTTIELAVKGKHVSLKVTIAGWDDIDPDKARLLMPQLALDWERKLSQIKKTIESGLKCAGHGR